MENHYKYKYLKYKRKCENIERHLADIHGGKKDLSDKTGDFLNKARDEVVGKHISNDDDSTETFYSLKRHLRKYKKERKRKGTAGILETINFTNNHLIATISDIPASIAKDFALTSIYAKYLVCKYLRKKDRKQCCKEMADLSDKLRKKYVKASWWNLVGKLKEDLYYNYDKHWCKTDNWKDIRKQFRHHTRYN